MWGQASNRWAYINLYGKKAAARDSLFNTRVKSNEFLVLQKRNFGTLTVVGIFPHLRWSSGVRDGCLYYTLYYTHLVAYMGGVVFAYIILYYTKPSGLYGRTTAGDCWVSSRLGGKMMKNKSGEQVERSKGKGKSGFVF